MAYPPPQRRRLLNLVEFQYRVFVPIEYRFGRRRGSICAGSDALRDDEVGGCLVIEVGEPEAKWPAVEKF